MRCSLAFQRANEDLKRGAPKMLELCVSNPLHYTSCVTLYATSKGSHYDQQLQLDKQNT